MDARLVYDVISIPIFCDLISAQDLAEIPYVLEAVIKRCGCHSNDIGLPPVSYNSVFGYAIKKRLIRTFYLYG